MAKLKMKLIEIVEDEQKQFNSSIFLDEESLVMEPNKNLEELEFWKDRLKKIGVSFCVVKIETTLPDPTRYFSGEVLLVSTTDIDKLFGIAA